MKAFADFVYIFSIAAISITVLTAFILFIINTVIPYFRSKA